MLSDSQRRVKILLLLAALAALGGYYSWQASTKPVGYSLCMQDPQAYDGWEIRMSAGRVVALEEDVYRVTKYDRTAPVLGSTQGLKVGDTVSVLGRFDAGRLAVAEDGRELHALRPLKSALGVLGALFFAIYALRAFRLRQGRLVLRA